MWRLILGHPSANAISSAYCRAVVNAGRRKWSGRHCMSELSFQFQVVARLISLAVAESLINRWARCAESCSGTESGKVCSTSFVTSRTGVRAFDLGGGSPDK